MELTATGPRRPLAPFALVGILAILTAVVLADFAVAEVAPLLALATLAVVGYHQLLSERGLIAAVILVILFVPMVRYKLGSGLPFDLEPYRVVVALVVALWLVSLLIDPRVQARRSGLEGPVLLLLLTAFGSVAVNFAEIQDRDIDGTVIKELTFFVSFFLVFYLVVSLVRSREFVEDLVKLLVVAGSVVAFFALVESKTGFNVFNSLHRVVPLLSFEGGLAAEELSRFGRMRVYASSQHPIALAAALIMLIPLSIFLQRKSRRRRWWLSTGLLGLGALATLSRTSVIMLAVMGFVFLLLRPNETRRLWPALLPALIVVHVMLPGTIGGLKYAFSPHEGLAAEQTKYGGRLADVDPTLSKVAIRPVLGEGHGTRIVTGETEPGKADKDILDNQWLSTLLETGIAGAVGWFLLFLRFAVKMGRAARQDLSPQGWLYAGFCASVASFAVAMLTFDAFSFIQVTFLLFILLGLGCALMRSAEETAEAAHAH